MLFEDAQLMPPRAPGKGSQARVPWYRRHLLGGVGDVAARAPAVPGVRPAASGSHRPAILGPLGAGARRGGGAHAADRGAGQRHGGGWGRPLGVATSVDLDALKGALGSRAS